MTHRLPANTIRLYHRDTPADRVLYPVWPNERIKRVQAATFPRRVVTGPVSADAEEFIHSWTQDDYSGGIGIRDANESTDTSRLAFGIIDARHPRHMCLPSEVELPPNPSWASGAFWPLGDIGSQFYGAWGNGIAGWDTAAGAWYSTQNAWPANFVPVNEAVAFCGSLFVPGGGEGFVMLTETGPGTGTLTVAQLTTLDAVAFGLFDGKLYAIDDENKLWQLTPGGKAAGGTTLANWGEPKGTGTYSGGPLEDKFQNDLILPTGVTPTTLLTYYDAAQEERLWCVTRGQGAFILNPDEPRWIKSTIREGTHPDWGLDAEVFRDGEDLFICGGGLDLTRFTSANVEVPLSGVSKDQGVPPEYNGTIVDLCSERSTLYALVKGLPSTATINFTEDPDGGEAPYMQSAGIPMWLAAWSGTAWFGLWEDTATSGEPTWMRVSIVDGQPALWWGGTDGVARRTLLPDPFFNPAARVELGLYPFAPTGWMETIRYDANMSGWDKVASHLFAMLDYASDATYVDIAYRTDADQFDTQLLFPPYHPWKRVNRAGRTLCWFDDAEDDPHSGLPWHEGLPFQWIQFRYDFHRDPADRFVTPLWMWHSLHHLTVPQDASAIKLKIPLDYDRGIYRRSPDEMAETLFGLQRRRGLIYLQTANPRRAHAGDAENQVFFRGTITAVNSEFRAGADNKLVEVMVVDFLEIAASDNAHTSLAVDIA